MPRLADRPRLRPTPRRLLCASSSPAPAPGPVRVADATASGAVAALTHEQVLARLLDQGEMIEGVIKPSRWSVPLTAVRWLLVCALIWLASPVLADRLGLDDGQIAQAAGGLALARLVFGLAQWFGVYYIVTNRRVMSVRGLIRQHILSIHYRDVRAIHLHRSRAERGFGVGTVAIVTDDRCELWTHLRNAAEVRDKLQRLIRRSCG